MARVVRLWQYGAPSGGGSVMNYRPVAGWGRLPEGWSYVEATSVAVDAADNVYVFNRGAHPVIVFDRDGNFLRSWGEGIFRRPHGITIGPDDTLWLTDDLHHTIRQFTAAGNLRLTIGDPDTPSTLQGGQPFNRPTRVALCSRTGDVYVSDGYGNSRVHKYDPKGRLLFSWGEPGTDRGASTFPTTSRPTPRGACTSRTVKIIASRSSTARGNTSPSSTTSSVRAGSSPIGETAACSSSASSPRTCR